MVRTIRSSGALNVLLALLAGAAFLVAVAAVDRLQPRDPGPVAARGGPTPQQELAEKQQKRLERLAARHAAYEAALEAGTFGQARPARAPAPRGWSGQQPFDPQGDDWEPAIAADPSAPWVYALVTRYGTPKPCPGNCPSPHIAIAVSADEGETWTEGRPLCACKGGGQFDPIIEVVPASGHVYAVYMNGFNVVFVKSTDHGATWTAPVKTYGNISWNDKPVLAMSDDGRDVYVAFNGPTGGDPWLVQSHDFGATWTQRKLVDSERYFFSFDADVAPDGTVYVSQSSIRYAGPGKSGGVITPVEHHVFVSRDRGATWEDRLVDTVEVGQPCVADGCSPDFYIGHTVISADAAGNLALLYDGATVDDGPQSIFARRSTDGGRTWSARVAISAAGEHATTPAVEARGSGDVRAWYAQTNGGSHDRWNVWYRSSPDGGQTWSAPVRLSDLGSGAAYKTPGGFLEVYGDYGEIDVTSTGRTIAIWGEGFSWTGPGGAWYAVER